MACKEHCVKQTCAKFALTLRKDFYSMKPLRGCLQEDSHVCSARGSLLKLRAYSEAYHPHAEELQTPGMVK